MNKSATGGMSGLTRGVIVFVALAVLTAIEYFAGTHEASIVIMLGLGVIKAALVLWYYMHIKQVFNPDEGGHE